MKLASVDRGGGPAFVALADDSGLVDLRELDDRLPSDIRALLELGPAVLAGIPRRVAQTTRRIDPASVRFLPVVPRPQAVWCAALNYRLHIEEGNWDAPAQPPLFLRVAESLCGHGQPIVQPIVSDRLDYEGELAVVIGTRCRHVPESAAYDVIAGYSCFNDGSVRDWQRHTQQITAGKNFAATGGFGPWLTTKDEVPEIEAAELTTRLNGRVMQRARIGELIFGIPRLVSYVSTMCELLPGDVIVTGTPGGVGTRQDPPVFMQSGDTVVVEVEGVGVLSNPILREDQLPLERAADAEVTVRRSGARP
jgi:2-keto-4-pentenoate hydratase/2-oxohepta-3-ene-1,7-dioic acid hydratase in catechol pathway